MVFGALAGGVDGGVFEQQYGAGRGAREDLFVQFALDVPAARVIDEVRGETQLFELKSHGIKLRPRRTAPPVCVLKLSCLWITSARFRGIGYSLGMEDLPAGRRCGPARFPVTTSDAAWGAAAAPRSGW